ncbi:hypothetical protein [Kitasatospora sp. MAP5-34]|uniref:hypothetical protein n=1 Tax=Kitasatospora sp. MAP5-34 TaxID=3035102 RepID=UPI002473714D|nr:hypothetical protein [Kitasatospora sp. MAP5-34]MDH6576172.1 hypothetical protein [Kitasatospora sp. MAP5-34]
MSVDDGQVPGARAEQAPEPTDAATAQEFVLRLRALKSWSGDPSLRELQRLTGLPRSTIADALDPRRTRLPPLNRVLTIVLACGVPAGAAEEWETAWKRIQMRQSRPAESVSPVAPSEFTQSEFTPSESTPSGPEFQGESEPDPDPSAGGRRFRVPRRPALLAALAAVVVAVLLVAANATDSASSPVAVTTSADGRIGYVARTTSDEQILSTSSVDLPVLHPVAADDALIVSVMLTSTSAGTVTVTDTAGNGYAVVGDVVDAYWHRTMIFAAFHAKPLNTADRISASYPKSSKYHIAVDEFQGITTAGPQAGASVPYDRNNSAFSTSAHPLACEAGELLVSAVGTNSGPAPDFVAGWQTLPVLKLSSYRLTTAYRFVTRAEKCAATGSTTAQWEAVAVTFR